MAVKTGSPVSRALVEEIVRELVARRLGAPSADAAHAPVRPASRARRALFDSPQAKRVKAEIVTTGKKLWHRQYVDGNGGNISYRIGANEVICTPTLCSKYDLTAGELCMVDLEGTQLAGPRALTSEILLHLEIYKAVPQARGIVHCHPPHATAYAITGRVPPTAVIPEYDVFVGGVAVSPYETPGTKRFAETVLPYVRHFNTVLLGNHGIVCWADTVTHAEWYAEVLETYCWTLAIAARLGAPIKRIPSAKTAHLLAIKRRLGLPDPRFSPGEFQLGEDPSAPIRNIALPPPRVRRWRAARAGEGETEQRETIVREVTDAVMAALEARRHRQPPQRTAKPRPRS